MSLSDHFSETPSRLIVPMLPMRDIVVFPRMTAPFFIGRIPSMAALEKALATDRQVFVVAQKDPMQEKPTSEDLYEVGTVGQILQIMRLHNGTVKALFEAKFRGRMVESNISDAMYSAVIEPIPEEEMHTPEIVALSKNVRQELKRYLKDVKKHTEGIEKLALDMEAPHNLADRIAPFLNMNLEKKQELLETENPHDRLQLVYERMLEECELKKVERKLKERVQGQIGRTQKEYYLNEQIKAIQKELGEGDDGKAEMEDYEKKIETVPLSEEAKEVVDKELKKLKMMQPMSAEANVVRNYLDWLLTIPWGEKTEDQFDLEHGEEILDKEHYGLDKVKDRIIEYLAVAQRVGTMAGPIICLVGPPGVGKTSLARSVAKALGRNFVRMSLGGVRDEAEIRGHRRTYIGAMPGKIVQSLKKAKTNNPLMLLDEIDKMTHGIMGDPSAALLEVLDREQNDTFMDHYLEVEFDLSDVLFFCTANVGQDIPAPLKDRMEVIQLAGYTEIEKEHIATRHLIPKQVEENGLTSEQIKFQTKGLTEIIQRYTREAGVRTLERSISKVCRKVARKIVQKNLSQSISITPKRVHEFLGVPRFKHKEIGENNEVGIASGLAWTQVGGKLLTTEVCIMKGKGNLKLTGQLGDVMKESARAALSFVRGNANSFGIYSSVFKETDIHIHVPEGAVPKDGPSAGITITTSLISVFTGIPVKKEVAMTGEITLRGRILPIGGLKEKLLAAKRGGVETVLIPEKNEKDLDEIPADITKDMQIIPVRFAEDALKVALECFPMAVEDPPAEEEDKEKKAEETPVIVKDTYNEPEMPAFSHN